MKQRYESDRLFFITLIILSLGCFVLESILRAYNLPLMPLRYGLKVLATFIGVAVFTALLFRYRADKTAFVFITIGLLLFALTRAFDIDAVRDYAAELVGLSEVNFKRIIDSGVQKGAIYAAILSLVCLVITSAERHSQAVYEVKSRAQTEDRLRTSEASYRTFFNDSPCGASHIALDGRHVLVNPRLCELVGFQHDELIGMTLEALIDPEDRAEGARMLERVQSNRGVENCQIRYRHKNGFTIWAQLYLSYVEGDAETLGYFIVISDDVTDRRRRWTQLTKSVALLEATLESTTDGILVVGADGEILTYNQRFAEMWQIPQTLLNTNSDQQLLAFVVDQLEDPEKFLNQVQVLYSDVNQESFDELHFKDGRVFERFSKPQLVNDKASGRVWSFRDVTGARKSEADHTRLQAKLREAQKMEALGTLASGIAHDFNNILSSIVANTEVAMVLAKDSPDTQECLADIRSSCDRSQDLISRIVQFTRQEGKEAVAVSLKQVVVEAERLIRPALPASIDIQLSLAEDLPFVKGDVTQFYQVLLNLCSNAATAMKGAAGRIEIKAHESDLAESKQFGKVQLTPGKYVCVQVLDDGCGMDAESLKQATEPFYTTKGPGDGSGLGLTVVAGIVSGRGGAMQFTSEVGKGTQVEIYFPALVGGRLVEEAIRETSESPLPGSGERILFVDDEEAVGRSIARRMQLMNYQLEVFTDPSAALDAFRARPGEFDLIMTDLTMPGRDGIELTQEFKLIAEHIPVILLTGYGDPSIHHQASQVGVSTILRKPVDGTAMGWAVQDALARSGEENTKTKIVS